MKKKIDFELWVPIIFYILVWALGGIFIYIMAIKIPEQINDKGLKNILENVRYGSGGNK